MRTTGRRVRSLHVSSAGTSRIIAIVRQALEGMPEGPIKAAAPKVVLPDREKMKTEMEALIYHFKIITEGFTVPAGEVYQAVESPRGEMGYYVVSDGTASLTGCICERPAWPTCRPFLSCVKVA